MRLVLCVRYVHTFLLQFTLAYLEKEVHFSGFYESNFLFCSMCMPESVGFFYNFIFGNEFDYGAVNLFKIIFYASLLFGSQLYIIIFRKN